MFGFWVRGLGMRACGLPVLCDSWNRTDRCHARRRPNTHEAQSQNQTSGRHAGLCSFFSSTGRCSHSPLRGWRERGILPTVDIDSLSTTAATVLCKHDLPAVVAQVPRSTICPTQSAASCVVMLDSASLPGRGAQNTGECKELTCRFASKALQSFAMPLQAHSRASGPLTAPL